MGVNAVRLNHAVLFVSDLDRSVRFWSEALEMDVAATVPGRAAFLRLRGGTNHHDLGLFGLGAGVRKPPQPAVGLYHLAWQVDTIDDLVAARSVLAELGALTGESSHGATKSLYAVDPDGNEFEVMWMLPREDWGEYESAAPVERLDLDGDVARWSGVRTAAELVPREV